MRDDPLSDTAEIVAYQDVTLAELRNLFDQLDFDLTDVLGREARISDALDSVDSEIDAVRARLAELGISVPTARSEVDDVADVGGQTRIPRYDVPLVPAETDFGKLVTLAEARLGELGIDLTKDPLQQVLPDSEVARSLRAYADEHGDISWDKTDWAVVIGAGALATLVDVVLVRTPNDIKLRNGPEHPGSPLTKWLNENSDTIHKRFFKGFENYAKVPFDASTSARTDGRVSHMSPSNHRIKSPGHDPIAGLVFGVRDIMNAAGTYFDNGRTVLVPTDYDPTNLIEAFLKEVSHLLSDVATPKGLPAPLLTLLQLADGQSPFVRTKAGKEIKASWAEIAQYLYWNGYDLRHFLTMGLTPFVVEAIIRLYWFLESYLEGGSKKQRELEKAKLTSMLLLGHTIATSGTFLKTGVIYAMNPLALNYTQILAMAPVTIAWFQEAAARDHRINQALEREWQALVAESS